MKPLILFVLVLVLCGVTSCSSEVVVQQPVDPSDSVITIGLGHFNIYFVETDDGYVLVDTGMGSDGKQLDKAFSITGISPKEVELIILTHGHADHIGAVAYVKELSGADVLCHEYTADYVRQGRAVPAVAHDLRGRFFNLITPMKFPAVEPDVVVRDEFDLSVYGLEGTVVHTPGHSQGSITIVLDNGEMIVGDLVRDTKGEVHVGSYYDDMEVLVQSLEKLGTYGVDTIHLSHGSAIDHAALLQTIDGLKG